MKTRANQREQRAKATPRRRVRSWRTFAASHWAFAAKAMGELKILARLARPLNDRLDEFSTAYGQRIKPGST